MTGITQDLVINLIGSLFNPEKEKPFISNGVIFERITGSIYIPPGTKVIESLISLESSFTEEVAEFYIGMDTLPNALSTQTSLLLSTILNVCLSICKNNGLDDVGKVKEETLTVLGWVLDGNAYLHVSGPTSGAHLFSATPNALRTLN